MPIFDDLIFCFGVKVRPYEDKSNYSLQVFASPTSEHMFNQFASPSPEHMFKFASPAREHMFKFASPTREHMFCLQVQQLEHMFILQLARECDAFIRCAVKLDRSCNKSVSKFKFVYIIIFCWCLFTPQLALAW